MGTPSPARKMSVMMVVELGTRIHDMVIIAVTLLGVKHDSRPSSGVFHRVPSSLASLGSQVIDYRFRQKILFCGAFSIGTHFSRRRVSKSSMIGAKSLATNCSDS